VVVVALLAASFAIVAAPVAAAPPSAPSTPALTELTEAQSQLSALEAGADARGKAALTDAVAQLGAATAQSLWADASDVVPPPEGDAVFTAAGAAIRDLVSIARDPSVPSATLGAVGDEILGACGELASGALHAAGLPSVRAASVGVAQLDWDRAFARLGAEITAQVASVPQAGVDAAAEASLHSASAGLYSFPAQLVAPPLTSAGKPDVFFYGAEACPFCAAGRWSIALALAQFGRFAPLALSESATFDLYPATNTLTFYNSSYTSPFVAFTPVEAYTNQPGTPPSCGFPPWGALQTPTAGEQQVLNEFDSLFGCPVFPFLDVANRWATVGPYPNPAVLQGMSWRQIAGSLSTPAAAAAEEIDGGAEMIAAQICEADGEQPVRVCGDPVNRQYQQLLATAPTDVDGANELTSVSCPSSALCVTVDTAGSVLVSDDPGAPTPTWSTPANIDGANIFESVSCPSVSLCVAVDFAGNAVVSHDPGATTPSWSAPVKIDPVAALVGVSCVSPSLCVAVDAAGDALVTHDASGATPTWSAPANIDGTNVLLSVSCASTSMCMSVDAAGNALVTHDPAAATPTWSAPAMIDSSSYLNTVSCPSTALCVATDGAGNVLETDDPSAATPTWTAPANIDGANQLTVSCYSTSFCVAADSAGNVLVTHDPGATTPVWSTPNQIDPAGFFLAVACPDASLCLATDSLGHAYESRDPTAATPTWSGRANIG
jgi:hypothetical protein